MIIVKIIFIVLFSVIALALVSAMIPEDDNDDDDYVVYRVWRRE